MTDFCRDLLSAYRDLCARACAPASAGEALLPADQSDILVIRHVWDAVRILLDAARRPDACVALIEDAAYPAPEAPTAIECVTAGWAYALLEWIRRIMPASGCPSVCGHPRTFVVTFSGLTGAKSPWNGAHTVTYDREIGIMMCQWKSVGATAYFVLRLERPGPAATRDGFVMVEFVGVPGDPAAEWGRPFQDCFVIGAVGPIGGTVASCVIS